jgi:hypothetical protein
MPESDIADATADTTPLPAPPVPAEEQHSPSAGAPDPNLALFLQAARDPQVDVAKLKELMAMRKEMEQDAARRAFYAALAAAKGEFEPIIKRRLVDYQHRDERGRTTYKYEELADIAHIVDPILSRHGLSYRHRTVQGANGKITVTCILSHADGYSEENSLDGVEDKSGQKNPIQAIISTNTYLQRGTLKNGLGIAAGRDDDGQGGDDDPLIAADDVVYIETLINDTGSDLARLLNTVHADSVAEMRASQFKQAAWLLETLKRRDKKAKAAADGTAQ